MSDLLPLPKHLVWRKIVVNVYALAFTSVLIFGWDLFRHRSWHWGEVIYLAFVLTISSLMEKFDYYGWRDKHWPFTNINSDRDEARPSRKPIDNRSQEN